MRFHLVLLYCSFSWGCTDFKSWESPYGKEIAITFQKEKDDQGRLKSLSSAKIEEQLRGQCWLYVISDDQPLGDFPGHPDPNFHLGQPLKLNLHEAKNQVSFLVRDQDQYYHKVVVEYDRVASLISHQAGGLQQKYMIKNVRFIQKKERKPIFKGYTIKQSVPLLKDAESGHIVIIF